MTRRRTLLAAACAAAAVRVRAADAVHILVAYPPGGISDRVARLLALQLGPLLGVEAVVVENRPGAGGSVALQALSRVPADGRTLAFSAISPLALSPHFGSLAPRVAPVSGVMHTPLLLVGTPALAADNFAQMVRVARAQAGGLRWATSGIATIGHLALEQVRLALGLDMVHVPYAGGGPQLQDALAGRFELLSTNLAPLQIEYVRSGRLTALAVGASSRVPQLPSVPTFTEVGCPGANLSSLFGLFAPEGTPAGEVARINAACAAVLAQPEFRHELLASGNLPATGSPADFTHAIAQQSAANARLVAAMRKR
ncbi:tripartite tricarboxylate transporter substrate binding protein [Ramlibacter sp. G-1-2-2]|uniref:Tripartite tricarboxylate transporter substrate binding protein n=1 Tax=Ramlibacter agri TaxID=2728837 RepID=A0A848HD13_9BURK|nr:tripartite tricarboxylate transporter substrate binding protein [Ramlibacter agri]NML47271.1 tripartite tricarboxylate transporter substrate binding protein [Ramlibacter agri]